MMILPFIVPIRSVLLSARVRVMHKKYVRSFSLQTAMTISKSVAIAQLTAKRCWSTSSNLWKTPIIMRKSRIYARLWMTLNKTTTKVIRWWSVPFHLWIMNRCNSDPKEQKSTQKYLFWIILNLQWWSVFSTILWQILKLTKPFFKYIQERSQPYASRLIFLHSSSFEPLFELSFHVHSETTLLHHMFTLLLC